jgi:hypothetical protein
MAEHLAPRAYIQVLGAVAYGERKAHDGAASRAAAATDPDERLVWRTIAAEELRHHLGFVRRLEALGADPVRAMAPYEVSLDTYHAHDEATGVAGAVRDFLGEGIATDLLLWLRDIADPETAEFIDTVLADEEGHEARALAELRAQLAESPRGTLIAARGTRQMLVQMLTSGRNPRAFRAFLAAGRPLELLGRLGGGFTRRCAALGLFGPSALGLDQVVPKGVRFWERAA